MKKKQDEVALLLRSQAEKLLADRKGKKSSDEGLKLKEIIHELQVYQVELEMAERRTEDMAART